MVTSLVRAQEAFSNDELVAWLRRRLEDEVLDVIDEFETLTVVVTTGSWFEAHRILKEEPRLAFTMFDSLFGIDAREDGFDVVSILYSVEMGRRVLLRCRADGGRDEPTVPTVTPLFRGADFHEREAWDMFGIVFEGHGALAPRLLCDENFEGWPLRKDFHLATREAKPWPGVKEPAETDEDGNIIEKVPGVGEAVGPMPLDELMAEQARAANPELVSAQEARDAEGPVDELKDEAEAVEAAKLDRTGSGHVDIAVAGGSDGSTVTVEETVGDGAMAGISDPDEQRARAAEHRAEKAKEIAQDGPATGSGDGEAVPAGDPSAFDTHGMDPAKEQVDGEQLGKDELDVAAARDRGEIDEQHDPDGAVSANDPATWSVPESGHSTDQEKSGANPRDEGPIGRDDAQTPPDDAADADAAASEDDEDDK